MTRKTAHPRESFFFFLIFRYNSTTQASLIRSFACSVCTIKNYGNKVTLCIPYLFIWSKYKSREMLTMRMFIYQMLTNFDIYGKKHLYFNTVINAGIFENLVTNDTINSLFWFHTILDNGHLIYPFLHTSTHICTQQLHRHIN